MKRLNRSDHFRACLLCKERHVGCHATCEKYQSEKKTWDEMKRLADEQRQAFDSSVAISYPMRKRKKKER